MRRARFGDQAAFAATSSAIGRIRARAFLETCRNMAAGRHGRTAIPSSSTRACSSQSRTTPITAIAG